LVKGYDQSGIAKRDPNLLKWYIQLKSSNNRVIQTDSTESNTKLREGPAKC